jgi:uncharacterized protein HemX
MSKLSGSKLPTLDIFGSNKKNKGKQRDEEANEVESEGTDESDDESVEDTSPKSWGDFLWQKIYYIIFIVLLIIVLGTCVYVFSFRQLQEYHNIRNLRHKTVPDTHVQEPKQMQPPDAQPIPATVSERIKRLNEQRKATQPEPVEIIAIVTTPVPEEVPDKGKVRIDETQNQIFEITETYDILSEGDP